MSAAEAHVTLADERFAITRVLLSMLVLLTAAALQASTPPPSTRELAIERPAYTLAAVLELPIGADPAPVVVLIGGAGPDTRDAGTIRTSRGANGTFIALSTALRARGVAVVRVDEVGTGASSGDYRNSATTTSLAADVAAVIRAVRADARVDGTRVGLIGFSEGATIAALVAADDATIGAVVGLSAPAHTGAAIMAFQDSVARKRAARLPSAERLEDSTARTREHQTRQRAEAWYREFLTLDPLNAWPRVRAPSFLVHGARDVQVPASDAQRIARARGTAACTRVLVAPALGHTLVSDPWARTPEPLDADVQQRVVGWLTCALATGATQRNAACC